MKVTITFEMDEKTARLFRNSSIERVINTSLGIVDCSDEDEELKDVNLEDWQEWKPVVCSFWTSMQDAIYRIVLKQAPNPDPYVLHKGEIR